jgi:hypothetical protein
MLRIVSPENQIKSKPCCCLASKSQRDSPARWWSSHDGGGHVAVVAKHTSVAVLLLCVLCVRANGRASAFRMEEEKEKETGMCLCRQWLLGVFLLSQNSSWYCIIITKVFISLEFQSLMGFKSRYVHLNNVFFSLSLSLLLFMPAYI